MNKSEFIEALQKKLSGLPQSDIDASVEYYCEMIDDRIEEGVEEEAAVAEVGSPDKISEAIIADMSFSKVLKSRAKSKKKLSVLEIILLALGSPIWLSLAAALFTIVIAEYVVIWSGAVSLWAIDIALAVSALGGVAIGVVMLAFGNLSGLIMLGLALLCAGVSIFMFYLCFLVSKYICILSKKIIILIKKCFLGKGKAK